MKILLLKISMIIAVLTSFSYQAEACTCYGSPNICQYLNAYPNSTFFRIRLDTIVPSTPFSDYGVTIIDQYNGNLTLAPNFWLTNKEMGSCAGLLPYEAQPGDTFLVTFSGFGNTDTGSLWTCSYIQQIKNDSIYNNYQSALHINDLQDTIDACREVSTKHIDLAKAIQVYPNPVREVLNIDNRSGATLLSVQLSDITGRKVLLKEGKDLHAISLGQMNSGLYFLQIKTDKGILSRKIHIAE